VNWQQLHGRPEPPRPLPRLQAGPVEAQLDGVELRYVRWGEVELVRRLMVAVRDVDWRTIPGRIDQLGIDRHSDRFLIHCRVLHERDEIKFRWNGTIEGRPDGTISYAMAGEALASFPYARIGICVLLPFEHYVGHSYEGTGEDGGCVTAVFPHEIAPQLIDERGLDRSGFPAISDLRVALEGIDVEYRFIGEIFEAEDQRNWTDASFKLYCPPSSRPQRVEATSGYRIEHAVRIEPHPRAARRIRSSETVSLALEEAVGGVPAIGTELRQLPTPSQIASLHTLELAHLRVELDPTQLDPNWLTAVRHTADELEAAVELVLFVGDNVQRELELVAELLRSLPLARAAVLPRDGLATTPDLLRAARPLLPPSVPVGGGSRRDFMEVNLVRPDTSEFDFIAWGINSQVHADDNISLLESAFAHGETARTAHSIAPSTNLVVSPISLKPRPQHDSRHGTQLAAAWTATSLASLLAAGPTSLTYFEACGGSGLLEGKGRRLPLTTPLAFACSQHDGTTVAVKTSDPLRINAVAIESHGRVQVLVVNATPFGQRAKLEGMPLTLKPYEVHIADLSGVQPRDRRLA
jgi:hypothetical protein